MAKVELEELLKKFNRDNILHILNNTEFLKEYKKAEIMALIKEQSSDMILKIMSDYDFVRNCKLSPYDIYELFNSLGQNEKVEILSNPNYFKEKIRITEFGIVRMILTINDEKTKEDLMKLYELGNESKVKAIVELSDTEKEKIISENKFDLNSENIEKIMASMKIDNLVQLVNNNIDFLKENNIRLCRTVEKLKVEQQKEFVSKIRELHLSDIEKRACIFFLKDEVKKDIDIQGIPEELKYVMQIKKENNKVVLDFEKNPEDYIGLDEWIDAEPIKYTEEERKYFLNLCEVCPNMNIYGYLKFKASTPEEYVEGEKYINELLKGLNPEWSDIQKVAYIDNCIGKKLRYDPQYETEVYDECKDNTLWTVLNTGYGVCGGIAQVENYILERAGIESEVIIGGRNTPETAHAFIKLKNIELPQKDGSSVIGDTILDPTWNLAEQKFGGVPRNFCVNYEEIRMHDVDADGRDFKCHENDEKLESASIKLDEESLREVYKQIGIANENGEFPIRSIIDKYEKICELGLKSNEYLPQVLKLLQKIYPDFAHSVNETTSLVYSVLDDENFNCDKCVIKRVYKKDDKEKMANLYVYADFGKDGRVFYVADREKGEFIKLEQKEFEEQYECYQMDLDRSGGIRPWQSTEKIADTKSLYQSSGRAVACEGEER